MARLVLSTEGMAVRPAAIRLEHNRPLRTYLRRMVAHGHASTDDAAKIIRLAGKLSTDEQRAVEQALDTIGAGRVDPLARDELDGFIADEGVARSAARRSGLASCGVFASLAAGGAGVTAAAHAVATGVSFGSEPVVAVVATIAGLYGAGAAVGCLLRAFVRGHAAAVGYGVDE